MTIRTYPRGFVLIMAWLVPAALAAQQPLRVDSLGVLRGRGADVLVFNDYYGQFGDEKISGVELIHHGVRTATNGDVRLSPTPEQWDPTPRLVGRDVDRASGRVTARLSYPAYDFSYRVEASPSGDGVLVRVLLDAPLPERLVGRAGLNIEFLPSAYFGKTYLADGAPGLFPRRESGAVERAPAPLGNAVGGPTSVPGLEASAMASGHTLVLAPEDAERRVTITARGGATVALYDGRNKAQNGWFVVRTLLPAGRTGAVVEWLLIPNRIPGWTRPPVIAHSQVGYLPDAPKVAVIETDPNDAARPVARLLRVEADGRLTPRVARAPVRWGRYLRYDYARFDFSSEKEPGVYVIEYGAARSEPFRIARDVYADVWQPSLDTYLAVQMDHVLVNDRYRVWHGAPHLDDARQAPTSYVHFDLYAQGPTTDTKYAPGEHIPGLNVGGWHDAGDFDLRTQSQYATVLALVQARETFGVDWDQTTVDERRRWVDLRHPDGVPDVVQQIEHGTLALLAQYRAVGHAIPGIVEPTLGQYTHLGDAVTMTDNLVWDPRLDSLAVDSARWRSGTSDDRMAFTSKNTPLDYGAIAALAAASRVLRARDAALADECLRTATRVWDEEHARETPIVFRAGNTTGGPLEAEELKAAVELLITTRDAKYARRLDAMWPTIESRFDGYAELAVRAMPLMDASWRERVERAVRAYRTRLDAASAQNPFGVPITTGGWAGSGAVLGFAMRNAVLHEAFPEIIGAEHVLRAVDFLLGAHPASSTSLVSGVGAHSKTVAYGNNRADYSFIPGGVVPGVLIVKPDFPELKEDWPFLWYEGEYVIPEAAMFVYVANAAQRLYRSTP
ncbi:glycoside hydrolase family 9 [Gemmatirosa kalamazoonensis]|uniref:Glycoside hydrolase family 9 n=1 Tax=Gemmatirosa kalamazoonensis TaxID=861299 RepID=W0RNW2_9BACT|nr:glycoside hydrolase family 9 protein [Gemmatirosa kalamazoonensis]AHG92045.1 glycoside hydrolase family 9 [Gemmatirosa kalamazoonensis]